MPKRPEESVRIEVLLSDREALAFAQFLKRSCFADYRERAVDTDEAYIMVHAGEQFRAALTHAGYAPR